LTEVGIQQAVDTGSEWARLIAEEKLEWPSLYSSPLRRCLKTCKLMFADLAIKEEQPFRPVVKELLRERMGRHTCDRRSSKSWIAANYPEYLIEPGFSEADLLFKPDVRETPEEHISRTQEVLEDIFENDPSQLIAITMHSMASRAFMRVVGVEEFRLAPGAAVAFLIKATKV
jgi:broad specificity phosphatase PhoE